jgi:DNA topoisomerase IV, A subunit, Gram-positive
MSEILKKIYDYSLEEIMGEKFGSYSKEIIQNRAIPDVRDGLKPVQRRILYAMYRDRNTYDKSYKKSAKAVGNIMGQFHPHGDSSIYDAMVRMSQWWKQNAIFIDMHGNNGSMDGDGPAAMRYTESRLAKISNELLKDIDRNTVIWAPTYDDSDVEPTVLPAKFPNLLVNGSTGISAGYATNIPPHNLGEVIDATIKRIDSPNCRLETIMEILKGPDFPLGAIVEGKEGLRDAFETGRGKIIVTSKYEIIKVKGKEQIIISEIPFDVNKANLVKRIDEIRLDKKIEGILEARDESDREDPCRIVIDLKSGANSELIVNYLLKNTELQISYNYNIVAIVNRRPMVLGVLDLLDAYINHQRDVVLRRTKFDLEHAKARMEIVEGLMKAISILDEVIRIIRASKNREDATQNLIKEFGFTYNQADAIVKLQLYRLTNTDIIELEEEKRRLELTIEMLKSILDDEEKLKLVMKEELKNIKKEYATPRKTEIRDEITEIKIDTVSMIPKEDCIVVVTKDGYVKRVSTRSYAASNSEPTTLKEGDYVIGTYDLNTMDTVLLFTDLGNYLFMPVYEIPELKWKELGKHISNIIKISSDENIIDSIPVANFDDKTLVTMVSRDGMIKRTPLIEFKVQRYSKPITCMKLKKEDRMTSVTMSDGDKVFITTHNGYGLIYSVDEVSITGIRSSGVKAISLKNDFVIGMNLYKDDEYIAIITNKNTGKRVKISEFEVTSRARKGVQIIRDVKTNPYYILKTFIMTAKQVIGLKSDNDIVEIKSTELPIADRYSTGSQISKQNIIDAYLVQDIQKMDELVEEEIIEEKVSLDSIDERIMTIDDFLDNFEIE